MPNSIGATDRHDRRIENEFMFEKLNEQFEASVKDYLTSREYRNYQLAYMCECSDLGCRDTVPVTVNQYHHVHGRPELFILKPGHQQADIEKVTETNPDYVVVAKFAVASTAGA